ncbi:MAG: hypothetical protein HQ579_05110 [Candidatus Omnitrophica bacterium]|nr:hypothetical protein [Candidatus Omnitrophota bacterium]
MRIASEKVKLVYLIIKHETLEPGVICFSERLGKYDCKYFIIHRSTFNEFNRKRHLKSKYLKPQHIVAT